MRGHAKGPFDIQANLRVQAVLILMPGETKQVYIDASPTEPVLLNIAPNVDTAVTGGTNSLLIGTSTDDNAYFDTGDTTPGTPGLATAKRFVLTAATTLIAKLTSLAIAAAKALTISAITDADTQTVTIGGVVYTLHTSLSGFTATPGAVLIGADATAMGNNLAAAINAGAGAGTTYGTGTVANPSVTASANTGVVTVTARTPGSSGNAIAISETLTNSAWAGGATTLSGGANAATAGQITVFIDA
jgi:hypothetical protein